MAMDSMGGEEELVEAVSPIGQYLNNSVLSLSVLSVFEFEVPIDESLIMQSVKDTLVSLSPRFSSIMITDGQGKKQWKRVEVNVQNHINISIFPSGMTKEFYDNCFDEYLSKTALEGFPETQPLWKIHIINHPTTNAEGTIILHIHHSIGDGYSLMCALFSFFKRADNPSLPLTFPSIKENIGQKKNVFKSLNWILSAVVNTVSDFYWSTLKSNFVEDDKTPIRSGEDGVQFRPISVSTVKFSLDHIKEIKVKLGVTVNDVVTGIVFMGTRLYMQEMDKQSKNGRATALVLLNTRMLRSYKSVEDMVNPKSSDSTIWGNRFAFLHVPIPVLTDDDFANPLDIFKKTHETIKKKRNSSAVYLNACLLDVVKRFGGPKAGSKYILSTLKNTSMGITNLIGPIEKISFANHPIGGFYFAVAGTSQNLSVSIVSYMGELRISLVVEKDFIDAQKLKSCVEGAFDMTLKAARETKAPVSK